MSLTVSAWINAALSALLNGAGQGVMLVGLVCLAMKLAPRANAATRHSIWLAALLIVAALPLVHFWSERTSWKPPITATETAIQEPAVFEASGASVRSGASVIVGLPAEGIELGETLGIELAASEAVLADPAWLDQVQEVRSPDADWLQGVWVRPTWESILPTWASFGLFATWLFVALGRLVKLGLSYRSLLLLKQRAAMLPPELEARFQAIRHAMKLRRDVRLRQGSVSPVAAGFFHPAVLLPSDLAERIDLQSFDQLVRHELAHLRRWDDWTNLVQQVIKAVLFFHPGVWWLSRRLDNDREVACDDHVLAATAQPESYALFLLACQSGDESVSALAPAAWHRKTQIEERINMILNKRRDSTTGTSPLKAGALTLTAAILAVGAFQFAPRLAVAQDAAPAGSAVSKEKRIEVEELDPPRGSRTPERAIRRSRISTRDGGSLLADSVEIVDENEDSAISKPSVAQSTLSSPLFAGESANRSTVLTSDERMEQRMARLEKLVESLIERRRPEPRLSADELGAINDHPSFHQESRFPERAAPARRTPFREELWIEKKSVVARDRDRARHELAERRAELQAQMEAMQRELAKVQAELEALSRKQPNIP